MSPERFVKGESERTKRRTQLSRTTIERGRKRAVTASQVFSISEFESFTCSDRIR
jgi:hypothetical protein